MAKNFASLLLFLTSVAAPVLCGENDRGGSEIDNGQRIRNHGPQHYLPPDHFGIWNFGSTRVRRKARACQWMNARQGNPPNPYGDENGYTPAGSAEECAGARCLRVGLHNAVALPHCPVIKSGAAVDTKHPPPVSAPLSDGILVSPTSGPA
jgi:hypothetical protein